MTNFSPEASETMQDFVTHPLISSHSFDFRHTPGQAGT
jgi:hypothetical protein